MGWLISLIVLADSNDNMLAVFYSTNNTFFARKLWHFSLNIQRAQGKEKNPKI